MNIEDHVKPEIGVVLCRRVVMTERRQIGVCGMGMRGSFADPCPCGCEREFEVVKYIPIEVETC